MQVNKSPHLNNKTGHLSLPLTHIHLMEYHLYG